VAVPRSLVFRAVQPSEAAAAHEALAGSVEWMKSRGIVLWNKPLPRDLYDRRQAAGENFALFADGRPAVVVSLVRGVNDYWKTDSSSPDDIWLCTLAVGNDFHGQRLGRFAVNEAAALLRRKGRHGIHLDCKPGYLETFYTSLGFERLAQQRIHAPHCPCEGTDAALMWRPLPRLTIRNATADDVAELTGIRYDEVIHADRVRDADGRTLLYRVLVEAERVAGFGCLLLGQPPAWPEVRRLPQAVDLNVRHGRRGLGLGAALMRDMEDRARETGARELYVAVDPDRNPQALALYRRLGYVPVETRPVEDRWEFTASDGQTYSGTEWTVHLRKNL
jgi:predicted N-acetyltransferase YhbS